MSLEGAIAAHRFGLGARPARSNTSARTQELLLTQINRGGSADAPVRHIFKNGGDAVVDLLKYQRDQFMARRAGTGGDPVKNFFKFRAKVFMDELAARYAHGFTTDRPFAERLVWFWSNHFVVSAINPRAITFVGAFEREAIRPHIADKFEDMVLAAMSHPAMLLYLDNASIGGLGRGQALARAATKTSAASCWSSIHWRRWRYTRPM